MAVQRLAAKAACRRDMRAVMLIGENFQFEWGNWNGCLAASGESSQTGSA